MKNQKGMLQILVLEDERVQSASLSYDVTGPKFQLGNGEYLKGVETFKIKSDLFVDEENNSVLESKKQPIEIYAEPILSVRRSYTLDGNRPEFLYPPSTRGWLSRIDRSGEEALLFVHRIVNETKLWLVVVHKKNWEILEAHPIFPFECSILEIADEFDEYVSVLKSRTDISDARKWMHGVLSSTSPSWEDMARITDDVYIPNLRLGSDARETMEQLVPESYLSDIREQIMAFLTLASKWEVPPEDPVDYFNRILPLDVLYILLLGYVICKLSEEGIPPYVQIIQKSSQHALATPSRPLTDTFRVDSWSLAHHRISERIPNAIKTPMKYAKQLNESGEVVVKLPVTKNEAARSQKAWVERFLLMAAGFRIRTELKPRSVGLVKLIDITRAHQWPHKHMKWSASIAGRSYKEPHIQIMEMPPLAAERIVRARPNIVETEWSASKVNASLYDINKGEWRVPFGRISNAARGSQTLRKIGNEFGVWKGKEAYSPTLKWVKCLDATANLGYLADLEWTDYLNHFSITSAELHSALVEMKDKSIIDLHYTPVFRDLVTVAIVGQGPPVRVCSLTRGFLKHTPSATVSIGRNSEWFLIMTRLPSSGAHRVISSLPAIASEEEITLTCHRTMSYRSYLWKFYQRLLREDGTWDDDVTAMLSQIRLPPPDDEN